MSDAKNQTNPDSFSSFMFGLTLGIAGAMLLGTEEGRQVTRKLLHSLSDGLEKNEDIFQEVKNIAHQAVSEVETQIKPKETYLPDETSYTEPPPPPPPYLNRPRSTPNYFHSSGTSLEP